MLLDHRQEVPLRSDQALRIHKKLVESFLNGQKIFDYWRLSKVESLENEKFEMEYSRKCITRKEWPSYPFSSARPGSLSFLYFISKHMLL